MINGGPSAIHGKRDNSRERTVGANSSVPTFSPTNSSNLPDPVGEIVDGRTLPNGLRVRRVRVPLGVVGMIYEARPNVTVDVAALTLKSGNAVVLRGGSAAEKTNAAIVDVLRGALSDAALPADLVATIDSAGRAGAAALMRARGLTNLSQTTFRGYPHVVR